MILETPLLSCLNSPGAIVQDCGWEDTGAGYWRLLLLWVGGYWSRILETPATHWRILETTATHSLHCRTTGLESLRAKLDDNNSEGKEKLHKFLEILSTGWQQMECLINLTCKREWNTQILQQQKSLLMFYSFVYLLDFWYLLFSS